MRLVLAVHALGPPVCAAADGAIEHANKGVFAHSLNLPPLMVMQGNKQNRTNRSSKFESNGRAHAVGLALGSTVQILPRACLHESASSAQTMRFGSVHEAVSLRQCGRWPFITIAP